MTSGYDLQYVQKAQRALHRLPKDVRARLLQAIERLAADPRPSPPAGKPLAGELSGLWRLRIGQRRVLYEIDEARHVVTILAIAPRDDAYEDRA